MTAKEKDKEMLRFKERVDALQRELREAQGRFQVQLDRLERQTIAQGQRLGEAEDQLDRERVGIKERERMRREDLDYMGHVTMDPPEVHPCLFKAALNSVHLTINHHYICCADGQEISPINLPASDKKLVLDDAFSRCSLTYGKLRQAIVDCWNKHKTN